MALYRWRSGNPFESLIQMQDEMARLMRNMNTNQTSTALPPVNMYDDGDNFIVRAELAGLDKNKLDVSVAGDVLTIKAERMNEKAEGGYHRRERRWNHYERILNLPDNIEPEKVRATYKNGILEVLLPRAPETKPRKIAIAN